MMRAPLQLIRDQLAPTGTLRAAVNLSNPLLIDRAALPKVTGVSPSLAGAVASRLGVPLQIVQYEHPDEICAALEEEGAGGGLSAPPWDVALIAADPDRASRIDFSPAYCEIRATLMVREASLLGTFADADREGVRVSVKGGGAYDLWLTRHWKRCELVRSRTLDGSYEKYIEEELDALAGLRPRLLEDLERANESWRGEQHRLLEGSFTAVQQAVGCVRRSARGGEGQKVQSPGAAFLADFVREARRPGGLVEDLIEKHGVAGKLSLPSGRESFE